MLPVNSPHSHFVWNAQSCAVRASGRGLCKTCFFSCYPPQSQFFAREISCLFSSNCPSPKQSADYYDTVTRLTSGFAVLPLCYVLKVSLVSDIFDRVCDGITRGTCNRRSSALCVLFVAQMKWTGNTFFLSSSFFFFFFGRWNTRSATVFVSALSGICWSR